VRAVRPLTGKGEEGKRNFSPGKEVDLLKNVNHPRKEKKERSPLPEKKERERRRKTAPPIMIHELRKKEAIKRLYLDSG